MTETVRVNFGRPIPVFPFNDLVLLPHESLPLHIFEPRYRQMVGQCLDSAGQFAVATIDPGTSLDPERPNLRPIACVGQIIQHEAMSDGRYNVLLHGMCRARIHEVQEPGEDGDEDRLFRTASMTAIEPTIDDAEALDLIRERIRDLMGRPRMDALDASETLREWAEHDEIPTRALLDLFGFVLVRDADRKYGLLAEPDVLRRAESVIAELGHLDEIIGMAGSQPWRDWPRGMSWN